MKSCLWVILVTLCLTIILLTTYNTKKLNEDYFNKVNFKLTGVLIADPDCPDASNGFCILRVRVVESNISNYDPRDHEEHYYCVIEKNYAELYQVNVGSCQKGDTIHVDAETKTFFDKQLNLHAPILLYTNDEFYKYAKKKFNNPYKQKIF